MNLLRVSYWLIFPKSQYSRSSSEAESIFFDEVDYQLKSESHAPSGQKKNIFSSMGSSTDWVFPSFMFMKYLQKRKYIFKSESIDDRVSIKFFLSSMHHRNLVGGNKNIFFSVGVEYRLNFFSGFHAENWPGTKHFFLWWSSRYRFCFFLSTIHHCTTARKINSLRTELDWIFQAPCTNVVLYSQNPKHFFRWWSSAHLIFPMSNARLYKVFWHSIKRVPNKPCNWYTLNALSKHLIASAKSENIFFLIKHEKNQMETF